jgi:hypothetical protein
MQKRIALDEEHHHTTHFIIFLIEGIQGDKKTYFLRFKANRGTAFNQQFEDSFLTTTSSIGQRRLALVVITSICIERSDKKSRREFKLELKFEVLREHKKGHQGKVAATSAFSELRSAPYVSISRRQIASLPPNEALCNNVSPWLE